LKKRHLFFFTVCTLLFASCAWQIPETISVKTRAEYNFSMGDISADLSSDFSTDSLFKNMTVNNARVFDYFPGKKDEKLQQYYLRIPLLEIPVDFGSYFKNRGLSESVENMSFSKEIVIPSVEFSSSQKIDMSAISKKINSGLTIAGYAQNGGLVFSLEFSKITYSSGNMVITCEGMADGAGVTLNNGISTRTGTFSGGVAKINLASYTIYNDDMTIAFTNPGALPYKGVIEEDSVISEGKGITMGQELPVPVTVTMDSVSDDSSFEYCIVKEGTLFTSVILPSDWNNIGMSYEMSTSGGMSISSPRTEGEDKEISLAGQKISSDPTKINVIAYLTLDDASFSSKIQPSFECHNEIKSFRKIAMNSDDVSTSLSETEKMSEVMLTTVKSIKLSSSGLKGTYTNTLPKGNDIEVVASSGFLGLDKGKDTMVSDTETGNLSIMTPSTFIKDVIIAENPKKENEYNSWDFQMDIHFPGYTPEAPNRIEINDVAPGEKYTIALDVAPETNWKQIVIDSSDISKNEIAELGFKMNSIFGSFGETMGIDMAGKTQIDSVPVYLYCSKPSIKSGTADPFASTSFFGSINMFCGKQDGASITRVKDEQGNALETEFCKKATIPYVVAPNVEYSENSIITDISNYEYSKRQDIAHLVNETKDDTDLYLDFDVTFTNSASAKTVTITPEMLDESGSSASIGIVAVVVVPLRFLVVNEDINLNIMKMVGIDADSDLFGRSSASDETTVTEYSGVIRSVSIKYEEKALPFYSNPDMSLLLDMKYSPEPKKYTLTSGEIAVYAGEIERMLSVYPLCPEICGSIQKGSKFSVPRKVGLSMNLSLQLVTDGSITLFGGN